MSKISIIVRLYPFSNGENDLPLCGKQIFEVGNVQTIVPSQYNQNGRDAGAIGEYSNANGF